MKRNPYKLLYLIIPLLIALAATTADAISPKDTTHKKGQVVSDLKNHLYGEWTVVSIDGKNVGTRQERAYLNFNASDSRIYGSMGQNIINAAYKSEDNGKISFTNVTTTSNQAENVREEVGIIDGIKAASAYSISKKDGLYYLELTDSNGDVRLRLKRHNAYIISGVWTIEKLHKEKIDNSGIELVFDVPEMKLHGNTGCNIINGSIGLDRNKDWFVQFQSIISSRMLCDEKAMALERDILVALEEVEIIKRVSDNAIKLLDKNEKEILSLKRINP